MVCQKGYCVTYGMSQGGGNASHIVCHRSGYLVNLKILNCEVLSNWKINYSKCSVDSVQQERDWSHIMPILRIKTHGVYKWHLKLVSCFSAFTRSTLNVRHFVS